MHVNRGVWCGGVLMVVALSVAAAADETGLEANWPRFRGANGRGYVDQQAKLPPDHWSANENVAWKRDLPGRGWSSPIVWKNRLFLTTVENLGESEPPKKGLYFGGNRPEPPQTDHRWMVLCLDLRSGDLLWQRTVHEGKPHTPIHLKNSYASETPVTDGQHVYAYFGNVGVFCFDMDGAQIWNHPIEPHKTRYGWGTAASPILHGDRLYLVNDNDEESYLLALDKKTGNEALRVERDEKSNWSTPFVWEHDGRTELVTSGSGKVRSYDLEGNLLWWLEGMSSITIATPYEHEGLLVVSSGYVGDRSRPLYAIRPGATGDISLKENESSNQWIAWSQPIGAPYNPTTLGYNGSIYVLHDRGFLACFDVQDGSAVYPKKRIEQGRAFTASPWAYGGKVFCLNEDGVTFVFRSGPEFELMHSNKLADDDMAMASPAIAGDRLLLRTSARIYCIKQPE